MQDLKRVMSPNTASSLRAQKRNKLRDFVDVAGSLRVNFFLVVSATAKSAYLRLMRTPRGPTLTYRIEGYSLAADLAAGKNTECGASGALEDPWATVFDHETE